MVNPSSKTGAAVRMLGPRREPGAGLNATQRERFHALFGEYRKYVHGIGRRILGARSHQVEDLVQDVFLVVYESLDKLENLQSARAWVATVASRMAWRKAAAPKQLSLSLGEPDLGAELSTPAASPELQADLSGLMERLQLLPLELRQPWLLRFVENKTLSQVATLCDCSQSTVQRRLREAAKALRLSPKSPAPTPRRGPTRAAATAPANEAPEP